MMFSESNAIAPSDFPRIDIQKADDVILKWACICAGTGRIRSEIFDPRFDQSEQLIALNGHHTEEVAQYSLYAMHRIKRFRFADISIQPAFLTSKPVGIRRWSYRLFTKHPKSVLKNRDLLTEFIAVEQDISPQEGLAIGLKPIWFDGFDMTVIDWHQRGLDERVDVALLEHMAYNSENSKAYEELVIDRYSSSSTQELTKARIKEASQGSGLYQELLRRDEIANKQYYLFPQDGTIINIGTVMVKNTQNISGSNINIGNNVLQGDINSGDVNQYVELSGDFRTQLLKLKEMAKASSNDARASAASEALEQAANKPTRGNLLSAMSAINKWTGAGALTVEIAAHAKDVVDAIAQLLS